MIQTLRSIRCPLVAVALLLGIFAGHAALATDIISPANVYADLDPTVQLYQVGTAEFPAYLWEMTGNEFNFFVKDVAAETFPFTIVPGAPDDSFVIQGNGNVGLGTASPAAGLHVVKFPDQGAAEILARFSVADDTVGSLAIVNNSAGNGTFIPKLTGRSASQNAALINEALITLDAGASPAIVYNAAKVAGGALATRPLVAYRNNGVVKVTIAANGDVNATSFNPSSSRTIKHDIVDLDSRKADEALKQLTPVEFVYNDDESQEKRIGFIAEDVPEIVANADRQSVPIMDVVALLTRVVKDQQQTINDHRKVIDEQKKLNDSLVKRLNALESRDSLKLVEPHR